MPPRLTSRDQSITAWVARWQPVTGYQVARAFAIHHVIAYRRLATLRKLGYMTSQRPVQELPGIYSVTNHGFGLIGVRARSVRVNPFNLWGDLAIVDQVVADQLDGGTVLSATEVQTQPGIAAQMPTIEAYDEPIWPAAFTVGPPAVATYTAIGPGGLLTLSPKGRTGLLAASRIPEQTRVRLLTDEQVRPALEFAFAQRPEVEIVTVDPHFIGGSHTQ
ncbi:hypothetical protein C8N24_0299 [Solirubrobacter pauli]|uniref:Protein involved in plasmid replication-relaxation n=1 Tax=Solirubrobacter pauli TaxID=166793 RepID=A0A660LBU0_9ACTN|nr:hypothetical protein [Solirubrobacter pauli]RKQ90494.1 hypothetical protein C8N24_0299 [Solirubrobacter pauli]